MQNSLLGVIPVSHRALRFLQRLQALIVLDC